MPSQQDKNIIPTVLTAALPKNPSKCLQLIIWATPFNEILPASVVLHIQDVPQESRDVLSLQELLSAIAYLWKKGTGESPNLFQLIAFLSKMVKAHIPENAAEIPTELNQLARTLDVFTAS